MHRLLQPLSDFCDSVNLPLSRPTAGPVEAHSPEWLASAHLPPPAAKQVSKEVRAVEKVLMKIGGCSASSPLKQPYIFKQGGLDVHLLLHAGCWGEGDLADSETEDF